MSKRRKLVMDGFQNALQRRREAIIAVLEYRWVSYVHQKSPAIKLISHTISLVSLYKLNYTFLIRDVLGELYTNRNRAALIGRYRIARDVE